MDPFVLIHGAWHGAWCWDETIAALEKRGRRAYAPELSGLGGATENASSVGLQNHVADVIRYIARHDLTDVTLVGTNASAALLPMIYEEIPVRIDGIIFLDGLIPRPGESVTDVAELIFPGARQKWDRAAEAAGGVLPPDEDLIGWMLADLPEATRTQARARLLPHPYRTITEPVQYRRFPDTVAYRAYIRCQRTPLTNTGARMAERAKAQIYTLAASHDAMLTHPEALATRLLEIVDTWNSGDTPS